MQRQAIKKMMSLVTAEDKSKVLRAFKIAETLAPESDKRNVHLLREKIEKDHPALQVMRRGVKSLNPVCRDRFIQNSIVSDLLRGQAKRNRLAEKTGMMAPLTILVSPSMRSGRGTTGDDASDRSV